MDMKEFRAKYPQYDDMSDGQLGYSLWSKHYKDDMPAVNFVEQTGMDLESYAEIRQLALDNGLTEKDLVGQEWLDQGRNDEAGLATSIVHGQTLGLGPETQAVVNATYQKLMDPSQDWGDLYDSNKMYFSDQLKQYRENQFGEALGSEIVGSIASPTSVVKLPGFLAKLPTAVQNVFRGFTEGTIYGANEAEDNKLAAGLETGTVSAFMTAGLDRFIRGFKPKSDTIKAFTQLKKNPGIEALKEAKRAAYDEVDSLGGIFGVSDMQSILNAGNTAATKYKYNKNLDNTVTAIIDEFNGYINKNQAFTLTELDNIRKSLFKRMKNANDNEQGILGNMISQLDNVIDSKPVEGAAMKLARDLNKRYRKSEQIHTAFENAKRTLDATGSGGNQFNLFTQAVKNIRNNPNKSRFFTDLELEAMDNFIKSGPTDKLMRVLSKASPSGNGLTFFLTALGFTYDPMILGVSAAGMAAKRQLEGKQLQKAGTLVDDFMTGAASKGKTTGGPASPTPGISELSAIATGSEVGMNNPLEGSGLFDNIAP